MFVTLYIFSVLRKIQKGQMELELTTFTNICAYTKIYQPTIIPCNHNQAITNLLPRIS